VLLISQVTFVFAHVGCGIGIGHDFEGYGYQCHSQMTHSNEHFELFGQVRGSIWKKLS
jgi:hypothetical protein